MRNKSSTIVGVLVLLLAGALMRITAAEAVPNNQL